MSKTHFRTVIVLAVVMLMAVVLSACTPAEPELGTEENPFIFSFVPSSDANEVLADASAIADVLSEKTGLVIQAEVPTSYVGSIEAMCAGEAHAGALNTFSYIVASARDCAEIELVSVRFGAATYGGEVIVRADSGITSVADLAGTTFCRPDPFSTSGWIVPSLTMQAEGINPDTDLAEIVDAGGHPGVVRAVYDGDCDAGAVYVDARGTIEEESPDVNEVVVIILESPPIPNDGLSFATSVPAEIRDAVAAAMVEMTQEEENLALLQDLYGWDGLEEVDDGFYDAFRQVLDSSGVDVESFVQE